MARSRRIFTGSGSSQKVWLRLHKTESNIKKKGELKYRAEHRTPHTVVITAWMAVCSNKKVGFQTIFNKF